MPSVVCFGDSITWGCPPFINVSRPPGRLPIGRRWPGVMAADIGDVHVVEQGLSGRTTVHDDPIEGIYKNGARTLLAVLDSHDPLDVLIIMLGTNDFKTQFGMSAYNAARGVLTLVHMAKGHYVLADSSPDILIVTPPAITDAAEPVFWSGAERRCQGHAHYLAQVAERTGCFHFDSNRVVAVGSDGIHIDAEAHRTLGLAIGREVRAILEMRAVSPATGRRR